MQFEFRVVKKFVAVAIFISFIGSAMAYSPAQIIEVTDNFGNIYDVDSNFGQGGTFARIVNEEQEVIVSEETEITFCVTEVQHEEGRKLEYYFSHFGFHQKDTGWQQDNCATFEGYTQEDWSGSQWNFEIYVRDDSDITAKNSEVEGGYDFNFQPRYSNLVLPRKADGETVTSSYDTFRVSKSEYESYKQDSKQLASLSEKLDSKDETIEELRGNLDEKDSEINKLNREIDNKKSQIDEMDSTIVELRSKVEELKGGILNKLGNLF